MAGEQQGVQLRGSDSFEAKDLCRQSDVTLVNKSCVICVLFFFFSLFVFVHSRQGRDSEHECVMTDSTTQKGPKHKTHGQAGR